MTPAPRTRAGREKLLAEDVVLAGSNYVLVGIFSMLQRHLGMEAVRGLVPLLDIEWVDEATHRAGVSAMLASGKISLSPVDSSSLEIMRRLGLEKAFAFDRHSREEGFSTSP